MIVLDVDVRHIDSLLQAQALRAYQVGGEKHANLVVHRISAAVARDAKYIEWASRFDEKTEVGCYSIGYDYESANVVSRYSNSLRLPMTSMTR